MQETPETISVYKRCNRTTSALEAYNGVLRKRIIKKGNFYKFVRAILDEEFIKSVELDQLIDSGGANDTDSKKRRYRDNSEKIEEATKLFEKKN